MRSVASGRMSTCRLGPVLQRAVFFIMVLFALVVPLGTATAGGGPRDVLVVINSNSTTSRDIGTYYQAARGIPQSNICYISCPEQEIVSSTVCENQIRTPIHNFLQQAGILGTIDYIVLTKGVPLGATYPLPPASPDSTGAYSLNTVLACVDSPTILTMTPNPYGPLAIFYWGQPAPVTAWSHSLDFNGQHFYLVTRLDAYTEAQVESLIDHSISPALDGAFVLDQISGAAGQYATCNNRLGKALGSAYANLVAKGLEVYFDTGLSFISNKCGLMGYFSWSIHDPYYTYAGYTSNLFVPGSVADSFWSFSAQTFTDTGASTPHPLMADLIPQGLCGAGGYLSEPQLAECTYPNILFDRYTTGYNMAESFYAACPQFFWKTVVVGDPLMAPYASPPSVSLDVGQTPLTGTVAITANAQDPNGISQVKFYLDDSRVGLVTQAPFTLQLDTTAYAIGSHTIEAIAYQNSPVATQGSCTVNVTINNPISAEKQISKAMLQPNAQLVTLSGKVVTAGTSDIGDGFFMEETNRTDAIKVLSSVAVNRGDVVTVVGAMQTDCGERVISATSVTVTSSGTKVPGPLFMKLKDLGGAAIGDYTQPLGTGAGARNVSKLVKVLGKVSSPGSGQFYVNDGSVTSPALIICPGVVAPDAGKTVLVTGLCVPSSGTPILPTVRTRDASDIQLVK